jgi:hypothetical protein
MYYDNCGSYAINNVTEVKNDQESQNDILVEGIVRLMDFHHVIFRFNGNGR